MRRLATLLVAVLVTVLPACGQRSGVHLAADPAAATDAAIATPMPEPTQTATPAAAPTDPPTAPPPSPVPAATPEPAPSDETVVADGENGSGDRNAEKAPTEASPEPTAEPTEAPSEQDHGARLWDRRFRSTRVTEDGADRELEGDSRIALTFSRDRARDGDKLDNVGWHAGCNYYGGSVRVGPQQLVIDGQISTSAGCNDEYQAQDDWLTAFLESNPSWVLDGDELTLKSDGTIIELREVPAKD